MKFPLNKKLNSSSKIKAFSLIELSIVILIIGILIAGVTQSSKLVSKMKIASARSLTNSSPVTGISNLYLWLEPTLEGSFLSAEAVDGTNLSRWNDMNSQSIRPYYALKTASSAVVFEQDGINGLPTVYFSGATGSNAFFTLSSSTTLSATPIATNNNSFTFFAVAKFDVAATATDATNRVLFYNGVSGTNGWGYYKDGGSSGKRNLLFGGTSKLTGSATSTATPEVISATSAGGASGAITLYTNGTAETLASSTVTATTPGTGFYIGNTTFSGSVGVEPWKGFISEIIIYEGVLKAADRVDIERYLGKKYGIRVQ